MPDLEERFRSLARTPAPNLWSEIEEREPRHPSGPSAVRRIAAAAVALVVGTAGVGLAVWALSADERRPRSTASGSNGAIAFTSGVGEYHIATVTLDSVVTDLTRPTDGEYDLGSAWSPDGQAIAFLRYTRANGRDDAYDYELFVANADGRVLVDFERTATGFSWSPDGSMIAFLSFREETDYDIVVAARDGTGTRAVVVRPDGTGLSKLTGSPGWDSDPVWSPNGARIAYLSKEGGEREIFVMNADGSGRFAVTDAPANDVVDPVWSPDGTKIAFGVFSGTSWDVYVVNADGTRQMALADSPKDEIGSEWAPDGSLIAYSAAESGDSCGCDNSGTFDVYVVRSDGTDLTRLTTGARELGGDLSWQSVLVDEADASP